MKKLYSGIVILLCTIVSSQAKAASGEKGNGGDAVVCVDPTSKKESAYLLDLFESEQTTALVTNLGSSKLTADQKVELAINRLSRLDFGRADRYKRIFSLLKSSRKFLDIALLYEVDDSSIQKISLPEYCKLKQVATQLKSGLPFDAIFKFDQKIFQLLTTDHQAALFLHEIVYYDHLQFFPEAKTSNLIRPIVALLASGNISQLNLVNYYYFTLLPDSNVVNSPQWVTQFSKNNFKGVLSFPGFLDGGGLELASAQVHRGRNSWTFYATLLFKEAYANLSWPLGSINYDDLGSDTLCRLALKVGMDTQGSNFLQGPFELYLSFEDFKYFSSCERTFTNTKIESKLKRANAKVTCDIQKDRVGLWEGDMSLKSCYPKSISDVTLQNQVFPSDAIQIENTKEFHSNGMLKFIQFNRILPGFDLMKNNGKTINLGEENECMQKGCILDREGVVLSASF